jgi:hypothetical protein
VEGANYPELAGHRFEILRLESLGDMWYAQFAVDGRPYPPFFEPKSNVHYMPEDEFLAYMKCQSLTMVCYVQQNMGAQS